MALRQGGQQGTAGGVEWWQHTVNRMVRCRGVAALLDLAYDAIRDGLGHDRVGVFLIDPARHALVERIATDEAGHKVYPADRALPLDGCYGRLLSATHIQAEGQGFLYKAGPAAEECLASRDAAPAPSARRHGLRDGSAAPSPGDGFAAPSPPTLYVALRTPDAVLGLLSVANSGDGPPVTPADAPPLVTLAGTLALALERAALLEGRSHQHEHGAANGDTAAAQRRRQITDLEGLLDGAGDGRAPATRAPLYVPADHQESAPLHSRPARLESLPLRVPPAPTERAPLRPPATRAEMDPVTGLLTHRVLLDHLDGAIATAAPFALMLLDVDNFRLFNDTHGYVAGDQVLSAIAAAVRQVCQQEDVAARWGNDAFAVVLHGVTGHKARAALRRVQDMVRAHPYATSDGATIPLSISAGLACYPGDGRTRQQLIAAAEDALATTRRGGRMLRRPQYAALLVAADVVPLRGLVTAVDSKDRYTREHSEDVTRWALLLAEAIGLDAEQRRVLALAGPLHDVGKIAVPDRILRKPGKLTRDEYEVMKHHVSFGVAIIQGVLHDAAVVEAVAHHHERWDGRGYPYGRAGGQASVLGRILQIADAVSAMRLNRLYRQGVPWPRVAAELRAGAGKQFDPDLVEPFIAAVDHHSPEL